MKICQLCGIDFVLKKFLLPLIDAQLEAGDDVRAVCSDGDYIEGIRAAGYLVETINIERSMHFFKHAKSIWSLYWFFRRESFDVVHVHSPVAALIGRIAAWLAGVPFVVYTAHGFYFHDDMAPVKRNFFIRLERFAALFTDLLFTQSAEDAATAVDEKIMPKDRVFAIGNGVDISRFNAPRDDLRSSFDIADDAFVIGMIGRLVEEKGVNDFLNAAMMIAGEKRDVYFILIGDRLRSDHANAVDDFVDRAKQQLGDRLILTGLRDDIPDLLALMDCFCLPSWREGMPRTIIEAMAMSKPVIATNIRGSREEVVDGETGLLVPVRSPEKLAEAMKKMIFNPALAKYFGVAGRRRALELYDEAKVVALQLDLIAKFYQTKRNR